MKKKLCLIITIVIIMSVLSGCGEKAEIALITDIGTVEDGSFNQGVWDGI